MTADGGDAEALAENEKNDAHRAGNKMKTEMKEINLNEAEKVNGGDVGALVKNLFDKIIPKPILPPPDPVLPIFDDPPYQSGAAV